MNSAIEKNNPIAYPQMSGSLSDRFNAGLKSDFLTDVTFLVGPNRQLRRAHSYVLSVVSQVFWVMFNGSLSGNLKKKPVCIPDVDVYAFDVMIEFAYGRRVRFSSIDQAIDVAYAAKKYMIDELLEAATDYMEKHKSVDTIVEVYKTACLLDLLQLWNSCITFARNHSAEMYESEGFVFLPNLIFLVVLMQSTLVHGGLTFRSLVKWAKNQLPIELQESEWKASALRGWVLPYLRDVPLLLLSTKQFLDIVLSDAAGILRNDEILAVISHIEGFTDVPLPDWCNQYRGDLENAGDHSICMFKKSQSTSIYLSNM